jgi:hypothetical protein
MSSYAEESALGSSALLRDLGRWLSPRVVALVGLVPDQEILHQLFRVRDVNIELVSVNPISENEVTSPMVNEWTRGRLSWFIGWGLP